jgi:hypothetical protein
MLAIKLLDIILEGAGGCRRVQGEPFTLSTTKIPFDFPPLNIKYRSFSLPSFSDFTDTQKIS